MKITDYVAEQTERIAGQLCHFLDITAHDKLDWKPQLVESAQTRSIYEWVAECADANRLFATVMRRDAVVGSMESRNYESVESAKSDLTASVEILNSAILSLTEEDMAREFLHPRGVFLGRNLILAPYRNMAYHIGQVNLYQILYGDAEFHAPANWRK